MIKYPPVGSKWRIRFGPDCPKCTVIVISSGHGCVAVRQLNGKYTVAIDILQWERLFQAERVPCSP